MHDDDKEAEFIERTETALRANNSTTSPPQLTPTGKISHAKTRVYTQRYRKAWEYMPDFKGWLTSVPHQPTRAFCTYCRKNLHAHRLSLLKHTCTMKHQRGALMHQKAAHAKVAEAVAATATTDEKILPNDADDDDDEDEQLQDEPEAITHQREFKLEDDDAEDEEDDDIDYVVEHLDNEDMDDDNHSKDVDDDEYVEDEEEEALQIRKKLKRDGEANANRPDTLAEAMAHVHGDYMDENGESVNVELETVVESVDQNDQEMRIVSVRSEKEADEVAQHQISIETFENDENSTEYHEKENEPENPPLEHTGTASSCKSSVLGESSDAASEMDETEQLAAGRTSLPISTVRRNYVTRPSSTTRSASSLPTTSNAGSNGAGAGPTKKKTITLTSGGKTVTLDTSTITPYTGSSRFLLNPKTRGSAVTVLGEKSNQGDKIAQKQKAVTVSVTTVPSATTSSNPGSSQATSRKQIILKSVKPLVAKKPCISTHVLDTSKGHPVGGLQISLYKLMDGRWTFLNESNTTADGRCADLVDTTKYTFTAGRYKLHFDVDKYFTLRRIETMYPFIEIIFDVKNPSEHYHVPVLISPFGYTTYRGS